jgi:hypothetical protein
MSFNMALEKVVRPSDIEKRGTIRGPTPVADWVQKYWLPGDKVGPLTAIRLSFKFYKK